MAPTPVVQAPLDTRIGRLWVAASAVGLVSIIRGETPGPEADDPHGSDAADVAPFLDELRAYFEGRRREFATPLDLGDAGPFDAAVWTAARQIPYGETVSYGELAAMAGYPRAARAAGNAMARCPFSPVVPCHRVIHADGSIGGWGTETWVKRWLLDHERVAGSASSRGAF
ncbi:MAG: methylated-DNA--[protein]-cysteine S-methyltransferase [Chloroflexota bacterium]